MKSKDLTFDEDNDADDQELVNLNMDEVSDDNLDLVVCNDNDFKIINKPEIARLNTEIKTRKKVTRTTVDFDNYASKLDVNDISKDFLKIECKYNKPLAFQVKEIDMHNEIQANDKDFDNVVEQCTTLNDFDKQTNDLQTLLIMLALSPKSDEHDDECIDKGEKRVSDLYTNNLIEVKPNNFTTSLHNTFQSEDITEILNITPIRIEINEKQMKILKKYANKWKNFVEKRKEYLQQQRQLTLNSFFDKLARKKINVNHSTENLNKAKQVAQDYNTYQHR